MIELIFDCNCRIEYRQAVADNGGFFIVCVRCGKIREINLKFTEFKVKYD